MDTSSRMHSLIVRVSDTLRWLPPLLSRLTMAVVFAHSGWFKFHHFEQVVGFFTSLHLPAPQFQATLVASTELVCGVLLLAGLATRFAAVPLIVVMVVALVTAKASDIHDVTDLANSAEFVNIVVLAWLAVCGAGALSLDALVAKRLRGIA